MSEDRKIVDMQLQFEVCVKEVFWDKDGLKARVEVGYMGTESLTIENHALGAGKIMTELITTKNAGSNETITIKVGEKKSLIEKK